MTDTLILEPASSYERKLETAIRNLSGKRWCPEDAAYLRSLIDAGSAHRHYPSPFSPPHPEPSRLRVWLSWLLGPPPAPPESYECYFCGRTTPYERPQPQ